MFQLAVRKCILSAMLLVAISRLAIAQSDVSTGILKGTVTDEHGLVIVGAKVQVASVDRGTLFELPTGSEGNYQFLYLQPGVYDVRVEVPLFQPQVKRIELTVGQTAICDIQIRVSAISETVDVRASTPVVEIEQAQQGNLIGSQQVQNLPNVRRDFFAYVFTVPGVASSNAPRAQGNGSFGFGTSGFSVGGSNGRSNLLTVDGGENELGSGQPRFFLSQEAIQEYQVNRDGFAAEFGFTSGTAVNLITKSGANQFHGSAYLFFQSHLIAARNFFDSQPHGAFHQMLTPGFTWGGPILKDRLFFFTSYEVVKDDETRFRRYTDNRAILGPSGEQLAYLARLDGSADPDLRRIGASLRSALTPANSPATMSLLRSNEGGFTGRNMVHGWMSRIDYYRKSDILTGRFSLERAHREDLGVSNEVAPSNGTNGALRDYTALFSWTHPFSSSVVNQARVQVAPGFSLRTLPNDATGPEMIIPSVGTFGHAFSAPFNTFQTRYQVEDSLSEVRRGHLLKFGGSYRPVHYRVLNQLWFTGQWTFSGSAYPILVALPPADQVALVSLNGGSAAGLPTLTALQSFSLGFPFLYRQGFGNAEWQDWANFLGLFAQDSWKVTHRLSLDYGFRLDRDSEPRPLRRYNTVSPRVGFAWDPWGDEKTVIRGSGGIFVAPVNYQVTYLTNLLNDSGQFINQVFKTPASGMQAPAVLWAAAVRAGKAPWQDSFTEQQLLAMGVNTGPKNPGRVIYDAAPDYRNTYTVQASFGIARELARNLSLDVAYQAYRGVHIPLSHEINYRESGRLAGPAFGPALVPIDPAITQYNQYTSIGNSIYHGMTVSLVKRYSAHSLFNVNYTFSKAIDDVTDYNSAFSAFLPTNLRLERGVSAFNVTHNFVASGVFHSPLAGGAGHNPVARALAGVTASPIVFLRSGIPFTVLLGADVNGDGHTGDRPFWAARNTGSGANFYGVDVRVSKPFAILDRLPVEFVAEASNLLNHTNFFAINNIVGTDPKFLYGPYNLRGNRDLPSTSPLGFTAADDARRIQVGLKIVF
jgi:hypothetical protein